MRHRLTGVLVYLPDRACRTRDIEISIRESRMKHRLPAFQADEAQPKVSDIRLRFPIGPELPSGDGLAVLPVVSNDVPLQLVPRIGPAVLSEDPVTDRVA